MFNSFFKRKRTEPEEPSGENENTDGANSKGINNHDDGREGYAMQDDGPSDGDRKRKQQKGREDNDEGEYIHDRRNDIFHKKRKDGQPNASLGRIDDVMGVERSSRSCSKSERSRDAHRRKRRRSRSSSERSRNRSLSRSRSRHRKRHRSRDRHKHRQRHRHRSRSGGKESDRSSDGERGRDRDRDRHRHKHRHRDRHRDHDRDRERDRDRDRERERDRERNRDRHRHRHRSRSRSRSRHRRRDRDGSTKRHSSGRHDRSSIGSAAKSENQERRVRRNNSPGIDSIDDRYNDVSKRSGRYTHNDDNPSGEYNLKDTVNHHGNTNDKRSGAQEHLKDNRKYSDSSDEDKEEDLSEGELLKRVMGISEFSTTDNKCHNETDLSGVNRRTKRKYRQYMNRRGGFNRPLSPAF
ncbi:conserved protein, unknown function [Plasmodium knowlesi strain H]|uniref:U4/U6.U5 small nuclear ribonucleoprotein 27kDa protein domain-containing protein n=3 Tax=Plasmodium knowlesi TaxID=5850 RepID=A0A5K1V8I8_PLAKH|nr:U4/U6.U5 small nuclear ribonucleoprotein, putative [Plasmodium knowlesi strain H]OTN67890.1 Uncharacterized protein PKNOH_S04354200 [Plasmodium knowlesi]CAA9986907.1 U4/U6.U5 small nuclear ribonucleoprotein, putative [Plasmodium knowlesi strain H]SBO26530.1 conserved protein, unknown function [Plasmodium knowlesi strain H]SBO28111.1 conserved protein, unknown function [Plasmodium knowlesi strain H]VVS76381.1 U4/U6.U5 small nuclear ribonucleoprotein, putative [Plasmodium knowlesi strain H]|eukprot:XP_002258152.1 hypothetical protein, conserved in Plasmodium species [Plasmodium knowlesi strain H]